MENFKTTTTINENKEENIFFVIQINSEINQPFFKDEFKTLTRIEVLYEEITKLVKIRGYVSSFPISFALILLKHDNTYTQEIKLSKPPKFIEDFTEIYMNLKKINLEENSLKVNDISGIFSNIDLSKEKKLNSESYETITRYILFYNSSTIPVEYNKNLSNEIILQKLTNFYFDVFYLHKKIQNEEDKIICKKVFDSLNKYKTNNWYSFENSGNLKSFKFYCNLLLCSPCFRIKQSNIEEYQNEIKNNLHLASN